MAVKRFFSEYFGGVSFRAKYFFSLSIPIVALLFVTLLEIVTVHLHRQAEADLMIHQEALSNNSQLIKAVLDMQTGLRGFLLSDSEAYLEPYYVGQAQIADLIEKGKDINRAVSEEQYQKIAEVERLHRSWMNSVAIPSIKLKQDTRIRTSEKSAMMAQMLNTQKGKMLVDGIRLVLDKHEVVARSTLSRIEDQHSKLENYILLLTLLSPVIIIGLTIIFSSRFIRQILSHHRGLMDAVAQIRKGNYGYQADSSGNNEMTQLAEAFNDMSKQVKLAMSDREKAVSVKSDFLANMSHEIRTPLNGILGTLEMIEKEDLSDDAKGKFKLITDSSDILMRIINDILDISKMEAGRLELDPQPMNLYRAADTVVKLAEGETRDKAITLELQYDSELPHNVVADATRLKQILMNLVSNAVKFTELGSVRVVVSKQKELEDGKCLVRFEVIDTGIGINREKVGNLFQPFLQEDASITRKYGGTGLGLAICYNLVEVMSGSIFVESKVGKGTRVFFDVPLELTNKEEQDDNLEVNVEKGRYKGKSALVAEDNGINRIVAGAFLEDLGFEVCFALNGQEAVDKVAEQEFDVIFMDMQIPLMDGIQATRTILSKHEAPPPIIGLTANVMAEDLRLCIDAGMLSVITKPLSIVKLDEVLKSIRL